MFQKKTAYYVIQNKLKTKKIMYERISKLKKMK